MKKKKFFRFIKSDYIFLVVILLIAGFSIYKSHIFSETTISVAKVKEVFTTRHSVHNVKYYYFVNKKIYYGSQKIDSKNDKKYLNKYFELKISNIDISQSKINLDKEIWNEAKIIDAGLKK